MMLGLILLLAVSNLPFLLGQPVQLFVEDSILIQMGGLITSGEWIVETEPDRILMFKFIINQSYASRFHHQQQPQIDIRSLGLSIYDRRGDDPLSRNALLFPLLAVEILQNSSSIVQQPPYFYSTDSSVLIRFRQPANVSLPFQLEISKAVYCPLSLGPSTSCGRINGPLSCYCATFTNRTWEDTRSFCKENGMHFVAIESPKEDEAIWSTWGDRHQDLWIGASRLRDGDPLFVWDSTGRPLIYSNWLPGEPNDINVENCAHYYDAGLGRWGWNDNACDASRFGTFGGVCELHP